MAPTKGSQQFFVVLLQKYAVVSPPQFLVVRLLQFSACCGAGLLVGGQQSPSSDNFWTIGGQPTLEPPDLRDYLGRRLFFPLPSILFFFKTEEGDYSLVLLTGSLWDIHQVKPNQFPEVSLIAT